MHRFTTAVEKRLEALERRFSAVPQPETSTETSRRQELVSHVLSGTRPNDLLEEERETFAKMQEYVPIFQELAASGALDGYLDTVTETDEFGHDEGLVWRP